MPGRYTVRSTDGFANNLAEIERFLLQAGLAHVFDAVLAELADVVIPTLEQFPDIGRLFLEQPVRSVEVARSKTKLLEQLGAFAEECVLREYLMKHYMVLYARTNRAIHLLSIRHQRQLAFTGYPHYQSAAPA